MPGPLYIVVGSGEFTSAVFTLERPENRLALQVPSLTATLLAIQFSATSGTAPWFPLQRSDGTPGLFGVYSGAGPAMCLLPQAPTPWGRLAVTSATVSQPTSFVLHTLTGRW